jgi:hypothetical protein
MILLYFDKALISLDDVSVPTTEQTISKMSKLKYELMSDAFDIIMMMASYEERNALKPIMHAHDNLEGIRASSGTVFRDKLSSNSVVIVSRTAAKLEPAKDYKRLALSPRQ